MNKEDYQKTIDEAIRNTQNIYFIVSLMQIGLGFLLAFAWHRAGSISFLGLAGLLFIVYMAIINILKIHEGGRIIWKLKNELSEIQN